MTIDFSKERDRLFNKSFFEIRKATSRFVVVYGGSGSGKSVSVAQNEIINILTAKHDTLYIRKTASDLYESCYKEIKGICERWKIDGLFKFVYSNSKRECLNKKTKKKIVFKGIDDPGKLKSIVGFKRIIIEEADQLTKADFTELTRRARGIKDIQIILVFNPIDEKHWIKTILFDIASYKEKTTIFHYTYKDNKFLTKEDILTLELLKEVSPYEYEVYVLGKWGVIRPEDPYFYNFDYQKHVAKNLTWNDNLPIVLGFDFNVINSCVAGQVSIFDRYIRFLEEWHQKNIDLEDLVDLIVEKFGVDAEYIVTGDASGDNQSAYTKDNMSGFYIIKKRFKYHGVEEGNGVTFRVPNVNTRLKHSKRICNAILKHETDLLFDENIGQTISDVQRMRLSSDGSLDKHDANKNDYGHLGDAFRYILCNLCLDLYNSYGIWEKKNKSDSEEEDIFDE